MKSVVLSEPVRLALIRMTAEVWALAKCRAAAPVHRCWNSPAHGDEKRRRKFKRDNESKTALMAKALFELGVHELPEFDSSSFLKPYKHGQPGDVTYNAGSPRIAYIAELVSKICEVKS